MSDFVWEIKLSPGRQLEQGLVQGEEGNPFCSPASVTLGNHVLSQGHFECVMQG